MDRDRLKCEHKEKIKDLNQFMSHYSVPRDVQKDVFSYMRHLNEKSLSGNDTKMISELPKALQAQLKDYMNLKMIKDIPFFSDAPNTCLELITNRLEQTFFTPGEFIVREGEIGHEMFIIAHGEVEVSVDGKPVAVLEEGNFFGEIALVEETTRTASVRSRSYCEIFTLEKTAFLEVIRRYPNIQERIESAVEGRKQAA